MTLEFIGRLQQELALTGSAVYESVIAVAERVNRKVHILRFHQQASSLLSQIESAQTDLGRRIAAAIPAKPALSPSLLPSHDLEHAVNQAAARVHQLKQNLIQVDGQIRELKMETIHEDLLTLQRDLSLRSAALERFTVAPGSPVIGQTLSDLALPSSVRFVTIFRGPFLLSPSDEISFRSEDIVITIGLRTDLDRIAPWFAPTRTKKSA